MYMRVGGYGHMDDEKHLQNGTLFISRVEHKLSLTQMELAYTCIHVH